MVLLLYRRAPALFAAVRRSPKTPGKGGKTSGLRRQKSIADKPLRWMIKRSWVARPTSPASSYITALKVSLRPSTVVSSLSQRTIMPTGVGALWASSSLVPTVPQPGSSSGATLCQQAFSTNAARAGVANTFSSPLPMAAAVLAAVTATLALPLIPGFSIVQYSFYQQQFCGGEYAFYYTRFAAV